MFTLDTILLFVVGFAFIAGGYTMYKKMKKTKRTDQRLEEIYKDYDKMMDKFRQ